MKKRWDDLMATAPLEVVRRHFREHESVDARDARGNTPLLSAAALGRLDVVAWLTAQGADVDAAAGLGLTPLMRAVLGGHADVVRVLVAGGADLRASATGAPGFRGRTALDLARDRGDPALLAALEPARAFLAPDDPEAARAMLVFRPRFPSGSTVHGAARLRVHVRDHRGRLLSPRERTLELHYDDLVVSQSAPGSDEAARRAYATSYGPAPLEMRVGPHRAVGYDRGPDPAPDDPDGPMPAVLTWADGPVHLLLASGGRPLLDLLEVAGTLLALSAPPPAAPSSPRRRRG